MLRTIVAMERDGLDVNVLVLNFEVPNVEFDLMDAVKRAALDYCLTEDGKQTFECNCGYFNWADFAMHVPQSFCQKYGFEMIDSPVADQIVNWDEQLVDEEAVYRDEEELEESESLDEQIENAEGFKVANESKDCFRELVDRY